MLRTSLVVEDIEEAVRLVRTGTQDVKLDLVNRWQKCDRPDPEKVRILALGAVDDDETIASASIAALRRVDSKVSLSFEKLVTGKHQAEIRPGMNAMLALGDRGKPCGDAIAVALQKASTSAQASRRDRVTPFESDAHHVLRVLRPAGSLCVSTLLEIGGTANRDRPSQQEAITTLHRLAAESAEFRVALLPRLELGLDQPGSQLLCLQLVRHYGVGAKHLRLKIESLAVGGDEPSRSAATNPAGPQPELP